MNRIRFHLAGYDFVWIRIFRRQDKVSCLAAINPENPDSDNVPLQHTPNMNMEQANNPLHGITLENIVLQLVEKYGWEELGMKINIDCFNNNPGVKSSLKFLRKLPGRG